MKKKTEVLLNHERLFSNAFLTLRHYSVIIFGLQTRIDVTKVSVFFKTISTNVLRPCSHVTVPLRFDTFSIKDKPCVHTVLRRFGTEIGAVPFR